MLGDVTSGRKVKGVIAPSFGHAVRGHHCSSLLRPLGVAGRVAVELHPFGSEVAKQGGVSGLRVDPGVGKLSPLHRHVDALHPADFLNPRKGVFRVQDDDESGAMVGVLLLPDFD